MPLDGRTYQKKYCCRCACSDAILSLTRSVCRCTKGLFAIQAWPWPTIRLFLVTTRFSPTFRFYKRNCYYSVHLFRSPPWPSRATRVTLRWWDSYSRPVLIRWWIDKTIKHFVTPCNLVRSTKLTRCTQLWWRPAWMAMLRSRDCF